MTITARRAGYAFRKISELGDDEESNYYRELLLKLVLEIRPKLLAGQMLGKMGCVHASIDLSDGLGAALHQLNELNQLGFNIELEQIPQVPMLEEMEDKMTLKELEEILLYTGGDYELLLSLDEVQFKVAHTALMLIGVPLTAIGKVNTSNEIIVRSFGDSKPLENRGFDHYNY